MSERSLVELDVVLGEEGGEAELAVVADAYVPLETGIGNWNGHFKGSKEAIIHRLCSSSQLPPFIKLGLGQFR